MKTTIDDLNEHLFAAIERLNDDDVCHDRDSIVAEVERAESIKNLALAIIGAGHLQLECERVKHDLKIKNNGIGKSLFIEKKELNKIAPNS